MSSSSRPTASSLLPLDLSRLLRAPMGRRAALGGGAALAAAALAACSGPGGASGDGTRVMTTAYALSYLVKGVVGESAEVIDLAKPGVDAHGLELSVSEVSQLADADLVVMIPGFQTAVDDALASHGSDNALAVDSAIELLPSDAAEAGHDEHAGESAEEHAEHAEEGSDAGGEEEHDHGDTDPHFWHDPSLMAQVAVAIGDRLAEIDPDGASTYRDNAQSLSTDLEALDAELEELFGAIDGPKPFVTSHTAFAYLAHRYGLEQIGITGVDPEVEPSPQRLLELESVIQEEGVTTVFFETTASPKVAQTLADKLGIEAAELDNLETQLDESVDYPAVMRSNAEALAASWR